MCVRACVRACMRACVRACMRACVRVCVCVCVCVCVVNHSTHRFYIFIINITDWIKLIISSPYISSVDIQLYKSIIMWRWRNCKLYKSPSPPHLPPLSLSLAQCYEKKSSSAHFVQMFNWISHNDNCIANYFNVWVLVFLVNSSSPWLVTYKTECRSRNCIYV